MLLLFLLTDQANFNDHLDTLRMIVAGDAAAVDVAAVIDVDIATVVAAAAAVAAAADR